MQRTVKEGFATPTPKSHCPMQIIASAIALLVLISLGSTPIVVGTTHALASPIFTPSIQDQAISSFISAFYDPTNHLFFTDTQNHAEADVWTEALDWDIIMDAYTRTKNTTYHQMIADIYNHITSKQTTNCAQWQLDSNQDLGWWAQGTLRAYAIANTTSYRDYTSICGEVFVSLFFIDIQDNLMDALNAKSPRTVVHRLLGLYLCIGRATLFGDWAQKRGQIM